MSIAHLWPGPPDPVLLVGRLVSGAGPGLAAAIRYGNDGVTTIPAGNPNPAVGVNEYLRQGMQGAGAGNQWTIQADFVSGDPLTGGDATDTPLALSTTRFWEQLATTVDRFTDLDISIWRTADPARVYGPVRVSLFSPGSAI